MGELSDSPLFWKLVPDSVQQMSSCITNILYDSLASKGAIHINQRLDVLVLLQKWCTGGNHFQVNEDNYDCFIKTINNTLVPHEDVASSGEELKFDVMSHMLQYYKKLDAADCKKQEILERTRKLDREKCAGSSAFAFNYCNVQRNYLADLHTLNDDLYKNAGATNVLARNNSERLQNTQSREKPIQLAYSILNLHKTSSDTLLLSNILQKLSGYEELLTCETEFINYLWKNYEKLGLPADVPLSLLENFNFLYEQCFIRLCTGVLRDCEVNKEEAQKILRLTADNTKVQNQILNLLYELYACSNYNPILYNVLVLIK